MKRLLLLALFSILVSSSAFSQRKKISYTDDVYREKKGSPSKEAEVNTSYYKLSSGQLMQRASKELIIGAVGGIVGGALCGVGASLDNKDARTAVCIGGGVVGVVGIVMGFKGVITLGKAGKALDKERPIAFIKPSNEGLGINLTF